MLLRLLHGAKSGISRTHEGHRGGDYGRRACHRGIPRRRSQVCSKWRPPDRGHGLVGNGLDYYTHITSPIRRAVDLANMVVLQSWLGLMEYGGMAKRYVTMLDSGLSELNETVRKISLVHSDCNMLAYVQTIQGFWNVYSGVVIDALADVRREKGTTQCIWRIFYLVQT